MFGADWGNDTITDFDSGNDVLDFTMLGLKQSDLTVSQSNSDTLIEYDGNSILLENVETLHFADDTLF